MAADERLDVRGSDLANLVMMCLSNGNGLSLPPSVQYRRKADRMVRLVCPSLNVFAGMRDGWAGLPQQN
ncbi:hypothetical protein [Pseudomonas sp. NPDC008258]|uniref:hypothetical protein n=1 Tax=Pseudomonas sp. NPDC008258 TaxID=3364418 RepID=UPI0036EA4F06